MRAAFTWSTAATPTMFGQLPWDTAEMGRPAIKQPPPADGPGGASGPSGASRRTGTDAMAERLVSRMVRVGGMIEVDTEDDETD